MENSRFCSFTGCNNTNLNENCCFYEFPEDFNLCIQWVEVISSKEFFEDFAFQGPEPFRGRFLCSDHFTEEDFVDCHNISLGLKQEAVPFYFIQNRKIEDLENVTVKTEPTEDFWDPESISSSSVFPVDILNNVEAEDVSSQFITSGDPLQSPFFSLNTKSKGALAASRRRANETSEERAERRLKGAQRAYLRRQMETPEEKEARRKVNAERQAKRRLMETPEQREIRRVKDLLRARQRRRQETDEEAEKRRLYDATRAQKKRQNESEEEKTLRRMRDLERVTRRRRNETKEERMERLRKGREYCAKKRLIQRLEQESIDDAFLSFKNFEQDVTAVNPNFFQALKSFGNTVPNIGNVGLVQNFNGIAYGHFISGSSQDSNSFDGNSEGSTRSFRSDLYENSIDNIQSNSEIHQVREKIDQISAQT